MKEEIIQNPFKVLDLVEMTEQAITDHVDGPWLRRTGVVCKIMGPKHVTIHRHGELQPEMFHIDCWQPAKPELIEQLKAKYKPNENE